MYFWCENSYLEKNDFKYLGSNSIYTTSWIATSMLENNVLVLQQYFICKIANATKFFSTYEKSYSNSTIASDNLTRYFLFRHYLQLGRYKFFVKNLNIIHSLFTMRFYDKRGLRFSYVNSQFLMCRIFLYVEN